MKTIVVLVGLMPVFLAGAALPSAARGEVPAWVKVEVAGSSGTGCSPGTVTQYTLSDESGFQIHFPSYEVKAPKPLHRFCNAQIAVRFPEGWSFSLSSVSFRGHARIGSDVNGIAMTRHWFPGKRSVTREKRLSGPFFGEYEEVDNLGGAEEWSPCGAGDVLLMLKSEIALSSSNGQSYINLQAPIEYSWVWRRCDSGEGSAGGGPAESTRP